MKKTPYHTAGWMFSMIALPISAQTPDFSSISLEEQTHFLEFLAQSVVEADTVITPMEFSDEKALDISELRAEQDYKEEGKQ